MNVGVRGPKQSDIKTNKNDESIEIRQGCFRVHGSGAQAENNSKEEA
jgi:hypothetical protein